MKTTIALDLSVSIRLHDLSNEDLHRLELVVASELERRLNQNRSDRGRTWAVPGGAVNIAAQQCTTPRKV